MVWRDLRKKGCKSFAVGDPVWLQRRNNDVVAGTVIAMSKTAPGQGMFYTVAWQDYKGSALKLAGELRVRDKGRPAEPASRV